MKLIEVETGTIVKPSAQPRASSRSLLTLLPIALLDLCLFVCPMVVMGLVSFLKIQGFRPTTSFTLSNYAFILGHPIYLRLLGKTVIIAILVTAICLILGYPFAYFLARLPQRLQRTLMIMVLLPFWTSYLLRAYAWMTVLGERGLINQGLLLLGFLKEPIRFLLYNNFSVVLVSSYLYLPFSALALYTNLERFDFSFVSAAMDLGATPPQTFRHIVLPLTLPGIFASFIFVFIPVLGEYVTPTLVGGADGILIVNVVVSEFHALRFGVGAAMALFIAFLVFVTLLAARRVANLERVFAI